MIAYGDMLKRIDSLNDMYEKEHDAIRAQMIAKLTALEIGGWIEEYFDDSILKIASAENINCVKEISEDLHRLHGFSYKDVRRFFTIILGINRMYDIENRNSRQKELLSSSLGKIKQVRDEAAHRSISNASTIAAPSYLRIEFETVYNNSNVLFNQIVTLIQAKSV